MRNFNPPPVSEKLAGEISVIESWLDKSDSPLFLEIGCGVGLHPIQFAKNNLGRRLLAFERTREKYVKAGQRYKNNDSPENLKVVHGDASFFIDPLFLKAGRLLDGIFILYPNPYPKVTQANLRLAHMPIARALAAALKPNGTLVLASNIPSYIEEAFTLIPERTGLSVLKHSAVSASTAPRTHFEKKYLSRGELCQELIFIKK